MVSNTLNCYVFLFCKNLLHRQDLQQPGKSCSGKIEKLLGNVKNFTNSESSEN